MPEFDPNIAGLIEELKTLGRFELNDTLRESESSIHSVGTVNLDELQHLFTDPEALEEVSSAARSRYEAIILGEGRPVQELVHEDMPVALNPEWALGEDGQAVQRRLMHAARAVGLLQCVAGLNWKGWGTVFVVGPDPRSAGCHLAVTNRHVASLLVQGFGERPDAGWEWRYDPDDLRVHFHAVREPDTILTPFIAAVDDVLLIHPHWDVAVVRLRGLPPDQPSLRLVTSPPDLGPEGKRPIAVIGHPYSIKESMAEWVGSRDLLFGQDGLKHVHFGYLNQLDTEIKVESGLQSYEGQAALHDAATLEGNSGSPVVDLATGEVVAIHFAGFTRESNFAIQPWHLLRDPKVVETGIFGGVAGSGVLPARAQEAWEAVEASDGGQRGPADGLGAAKVVNLSDPSQEWNCWLLQDEIDKVPGVDLEERGLDGDVLKLVEDLDAVEEGSRILGDRVLAGRLQLVRHTGGLHPGDVEIQVELELHGVSAGSRAMLVGPEGRFGWAVPYGQDDELRLRAAVVVPRDAKLTFDVWLWPNPPDGALEARNDSQRLFWKRRLRRWTTDNYRSRIANGVAVKASDPIWNTVRTSAKPLLLLIHGTGLQTHQGFADFEVEDVKALNDRYSAVLALDHWTVADGVIDNIETLSKALPDLPLDIEVDLLAVSRGCLVARALAQYQRTGGRGTDRKIRSLLKDHKLRVRRIALVAGPHRGTPLARVKHGWALRRSMSYATVSTAPLAGTEPSTTSLRGIDDAMAAKSNVHRGVFQGRLDMVPRSELQTWLNNPGTRPWKGTEALPRVICTVHCATERANLRDYDKALLGTLLGDNHDLMVSRPSASGPFPNAMPWGPPEHFVHHHIEVDPTVDHHHYFESSHLREDLLEVLIGRTESDQS